jgi:ribosomal protein S18 acetylase RimI-like enzyme
MDDELVVAAAENLAGWHERCMRALGVATRREPGLWWRDEPAPEHYFTGVTLDSADFTTEQEAFITQASPLRPGETLTVCDCFGTLDLSGAGYEVVREAPWMVREPAEPNRRPFPKGLVIRRVATEAQLMAWEAASAHGFDVDPTDWEAATGEGLLGDGSLQVFAGEMDGQVVAGSMALVGERVVGIYAVSTAPGYRRRGAGEWLTWRAVLAGRPLKTAVLQPSDESLALYRRMGFVETGRYVIWRRRG